MTAASPAPGLDPITRPHRRWATGVLAGLGIVACGLAVAGATSGVAGALRAVATTVFLVLGPGWAVAGFLRQGSPSLSWIVAIAVGCALGALGGEAMLELGLWHPVAALGLLAVLCVPVLLTHAIRAR